MSLNIIVDADVSSASQKISKFSIEVKKSFESINTVLEKTSNGFQYRSADMQKNIGNFSKASTNSLTALSLVLQDLPFGFIGIQNNLPGLTQGFAQMSANAKNGASVLAQLRGALLGPAGLFLAFSAVTAAVTYAIKEYGSLGNAFNALISNTKQLSKEQKEIAANVAEEGTKALTLYSLYVNLEGQRKKQYEIIKKLNDISPEYFGNLDAEKVKIDELKGSIDRYIDSFIGKIYIESQQKKITELITKYAEKISLVIDRELELDKINKRKADAAKNLIKDYELLAETQKNAGDIAIGIQKPVIKQTTGEVITQLREQLRGAVEEVFKSVGKFKNYIDIGEIFGDPKKSKAIKEKVDYMTTFVIPNLLKQKRKDVKLEIIPEFKFQPPNLQESDLIKNLRIQQQILAQEYLKMRDIMAGVFFNPIEDLFTNFFETGKFAFKAFGDAVLKEIQRIVARIIATGIIRLLASILIPGGATAAKGLGLMQGGLGGILSDIFGGGGRSMSPSFSGIGGGGFGMTGQVNLVLRGQDLVGAINRTNSTINRVG